MADLIKVLAMGLLVGTPRWSLHLISEFPSARSTRLSTGTSAISTTTKNNLSRGSKLPGMEDKVAADPIRTLGEGLRIFGTLSLEVVSFHRNDFPIKYSVPVKGPCISNTNYQVILAK